MYPVFADWANRYGVEAALEKFRGPMPQYAEEYATYFADQVANIESGGPAILKAGGAAWYAGPTAEAIYWNPLKEAFVASGFSESVVEDVDKSSSKVVAHTPKPSDSRFDGKGLVVG